MSAIILLSMPSDDGRAIKILDALVTERLDVRWYSCVPDGPEWIEIQQAINTARCVLFCWSHATRDQSADAFRDLARQASAKGTAIGIELDHDTLPADLPMTRYRLGGWRRADKGLARWAIGKIFYNDIVAAAKFKAAGLDPGPPSAPAKLLMRQAWVLVVGLGSLLGALALPGEIHSKLPWPRFNEERAWAALPADSCPALAEFRKQYPDGRYASQATRIFENRQRGAAKATTVERSAPFYVAASNATPRSDETLARVDAESRIAREAQKVCTGFSEAASSKLIASSGKAETWDCQSVGGGVVCSVTGKVSCELEELVADAVEHCVIPGR